MKSGIVRSEMTHLGMCLGAMTEEGYNLRRDLTVTCVGVAQGFLCVKTYANVPPTGRCGAVAGARPLIVTTTATHGALRPGRPAGPGTVHCSTHMQAGLQTFQLNGCNVLKIFSFFI